MQRLRKKAYNRTFQTNSLRKSDVKKPVSRKYESSWALVVGINDYPNATKLDLACNDAKAISECLVAGFEFPKENVTTLLDADATRNNVLENFLSFENRTSENDRLLFFFAGHGLTKNSSRGQVG